MSSFAAPAPDSPTLFLDTASPQPSTGLCVEPGCKVDWRETDDEAGVGLFRTTEELLHTARRTMSEVRTVVFCEGPGSLLGIRLAAMAVRTWMALPRAEPLRVFAYRSLALVAADLLAQGEAPPFHVIHDARRETWNVLSLGANGELGEIRRCRAEELPLATGTMFTPAQFPHWQPRPEGVRPIAYRPQLIVGLAPKFRLLREVDAPDAFMTEMPTYRPWIPTALP